MTIGFLCLIGQQSRLITRPNNADELRASIKASWASLTPQQGQRLIDCMPRHINAVIHAKGVLTKYTMHIQDFFLHV